MKWKDFLMGFLLFSACVGNSYGEENSTKELPQVVVTATKIEESPLEVSSFVKVITEEEIKLSPAKDLGDLFPELGLGHTHKYPGTLTGRISLRGLTSDLFDPLKGGVLILIDGQRAGTANLAKIPLENIERIEIVKGPFSALYGTQAMGGVINIITKRAKKEGVGLTLGLERGSWDYWKGLTELELKRTLSNYGLDFYFLGERTSRNDYEAKGYGRIKNTSYDEGTLDAKLGLSFLKNHYLSFGIQSLHGWDIGSPGARYSPSPKDYSDKKRDAYSFLYKFSNLEFSYTYTFDRDRWHSLSGTSENISTKIMKGKDFNLKVPFSFKSHKFLIGGEYYELGVTSRRNVGAPYYPNSEFTNLGGFFQAKLNLYREKLYLIPGVRYDYFETEILTTPGLSNLRPRKEDKDRFTGKIGLLYRLTKELSLKANWGEAFRTPTADELAADYVSSWGTRYLGNSTLKPEKVYSFDFGLDYAGKFGLLSFSYFYNKYKDKIQGYYNPLIGAQTYKNIDGATIQGLEFSYAKEWQEFLNLPLGIQPFLNLTYHLQYKDDENKSSLLYIPKAVASFGFNLRYRDFKLNLTGIYNGDEKIQDWAPPSYGRKVVKKKDFTIFNLYAGYSFSEIFSLKGAEIYLKVENLFNRAYEYVQYYPMPERTYYLGVRAKF